MRLLLSSLLLCCSLHTWASEPSSREMRENATVGVNFSYAFIHVPFVKAWGANANLYTSGNWLFALDYTNANKAIKIFSFQLGEIKEKHIAVQARRFFGNSFNLKFGLGQRTTEALLPTDLFDLVVSNYTETASKFTSNFVRFGLGNQWQFGTRYTFVVDWFTINIPYSGEIITSASQYASGDNKQKVEDYENILKYYPSGSVIQMDIGVIF